MATTSQPATADRSPLPHRPLIGLVGRRKALRQVEGFADALGHLEADLYLSDYSKAVWEAGGLPVNLSLDSEPSAWAGTLDGVILTGGADADPSRYGQPNTHSTIEPVRDEFEFSLFRTCLEAELPVLGICRGLQVINIALGGTLNQHVPDHSRYDTDPAQPIHRVNCQPGSLIEKLYGSDLEVNTLHHQIVDRLAPGLTATGHAPDGTVEVVELNPGLSDSPGGSDSVVVLAVQWHPEMMGPDPVLFQWLISVCGGRHNRREPAFSRPR